MRLSALKCGHSKSCGCIKFNNPNTVQDLAGQEFGRLTALYREKWEIKASIGYANVTVGIQN